MSSRDLSFSVWPGAKYNKKRPTGRLVTKPWDEWCDDLLSHERRGDAPPPELLEPLPKDAPPALAKAAQDAEAALDKAKEGPGLVFGEIPEGKPRENGCVVAVHAFALDIDRGTLDQVVEALRPFRRWEQIIYSSHRHGFLGQVKVRAVFPLSRAITPAEHARLWSILNAMAGGFNDERTRNVARFFYAPSSWPGAKVIAERIRGPWIDPDELIGALPASPGAATPPPSADVEEEIRRARSILRRLPVGDDLRDPAGAVAKGEAFAQAGSRHDLMLRITMFLAFRTREKPLSRAAVEALFAPSLLASAPPGTPPAEPPSAAADAYEGALAKVVEQHARDRADEERKLFEAQRAGAAGYTDAELEELAKDHGGDLSRRWIIQRDTSFWFLGAGGKYNGPYSDKEAGAAIAHELRRAPVRLYDNGRDGRVARTMVELVRDHGSVARRVITDLGAAASSWDAETRVFREATCPLRKLEPKDDPTIRKWLELMAGPLSGKLLDWIACASRLNRLLCAIYFIGPKGVGKTLFAHGMAQLWTDGAPTKASEFFGSDFDESVLSCPLVFGDESLPKFFKGESITEMLRSALSTFARKVRRKFRATTDASGALRIVIAGNNDHLLATPSMSPDDVLATAEKVLFVDCSQAAADFLKLVPEAEKERWRTGGLASFALHLAQTREVTQQNGRFYVEGDMGESIRNLLTTTDWTSRVCEWCARYLLSPGGADEKGDGMVRREGGELLVNVKAITDGWKLYMQEQHMEPATNKIAGALRAISRGNRQLRWQGKHVYYTIVDLENIAAWAHKSQFCAREDIFSAIEAPGEAPGPNVVQAAERFAPPPPAPPPAAHEDDEAEPDGTPF